jgi:hypothetical protein
VIAKRKQIEINYEVQFLINSILKDEIKKEKKSPSQLTKLVTWVMRPI